MLGVAACGFGSGGGAGEQPGQRSQSAPPDPRTLAIPASQDGRFSVDAPAAMRGDARAGPFGDIKPLEIRPGGSLGSLGLNLKTFMGEDLRNTDARVERLEHVIAAMHSDVATLAPAMQRMAVIEKDIEALVTQLEALLQDEGYSAPAPAPVPAPAPAISAPQVLMPPADDSVVDEDDGEDAVEDAPVAQAKAAPAPPPAPAPSVAPPPSASAAGLQATNLRVGQHHDRTRLVIDLNGPVNYNVDLDNMEKLLVIELNGASWRGAATQSFNTPPLQSMNTQSLDNNSGTRVIIVLRKDSAVLSQSLLKPGDGNPHHRLVIDLRN